MCTFWFIDFCSNKWIQINSTGYKKIITIPFVDKNIQTFSNFLGFRQIYRPNIYKGTQQYTYKWTIS